MLPKPPRADIPAPPSLSPEGRRHVEIREELGLPDGAAGQHRQQLVDMVMHLLGPTEAQEHQQQRLSLIQEDMLARNRDLGPLAADAYQTRRLRHPGEPA